MDKSKAILYLSSLGLYSNEITYILDKYENPIEIIKSDSLDKNISIERRVKKKYLKNRNDDCIYKFQQSGEIYEYKGPNLKTVHFIFNKHYIDILRSHKSKKDPEE